MPNFQPLKILCCNVVIYKVTGTKEVGLRSVYSSPWKCLSMFSSSAIRFLASSFSRFLAFLIHFNVSSPSASASPNVDPFSDALSSRLFFTLRYACISKSSRQWMAKALKTDGDDWWRCKSSSTHFAIRSWTRLWEEKYTISFTKQV